MQNILIIDDLQSELDLMVNYLTNAGYDIMMATNGEEAIAKTLESKPDAIITDWMMPKIWRFRYLPSTEKESYNGGDSCHCLYG